MTGPDDFDRTLAGWFEADVPSPAPAGGLDRVLDTTSRRRPRPAWLAGPGSDWVRETPATGSSSSARSLPRLGTRWSVALILLLVIAALVGGAILVGARLFKPSPLPTGRLGQLAYGLAGDIFVADWDGKDPVRIAGGRPRIPADSQGFWAEGPIWSPDGQHLAYRSGGGGDPCCGTVYVSDPAGHVVASFPGTGWLVSWSPDSTRVATWVELAKTIGIYGLNGVRQALLAVPPGLAPSGDYDPVWSPDGGSLLIRLAPPSPSVVWELPVDGGAPRRVSADDPRSHLATYSPDGARAAYIVAGFPTQSLDVAAADGSQPRVLIGGVAPGSLGSPVWSPTGDRIAFVWRSNSLHDPAGSQLPGNYELRVVNVASGKVTSLATARAPDDLNVIEFSPEGDRILYEITRATTVGATSVWSVDADGSHPQLLVTGTGWGDFDWQRRPAGP